MHFINAFLPRGLAICLLLEAGGSFEGTTGVFLSQPFSFTLCFTHFSTDCLSVSWGSFCLYKLGFRNCLGYMSPRCILDNQKLCDPLCLKYNSAYSPWLWIYWSVKVHQFQRKLSTIKTTNIRIQYNDMLVENGFFNH